MKVALGQINPTIGDFQGNIRLAQQMIEQAQSARADLLVLPELAAIGYPPRDLLLREDIVSRNLAALDEIAKSCHSLAAIVGFVARNTTNMGPPLHNAAAFCTDGRVASTHFKCLLPNYDVFDERRYFQPGQNPSAYLWEKFGVRLGISICEDLWNDQQFIDRRLYQNDPIEQLVRQGADVLINISASPFWVGKQAQRQAIFGQQVAEHGKPLIYVNQVGGHDDLLFDGGSMVFDRTGKIIVQAKAFEEDFVVVDVDHPDGVVTPYPDDIDCVIRALILGTRDYVRKCGFKEVVIGSSGGIDSALVAYIAAQALGRQAVHTVAMPSRFSSEHSLQDAKQLAENLGIDFRMIPIEPMHAAAEASLRETFAGRKPDATEENLQARIRGQIMMALSNKFGWLLLTTGNKSEIAVGYCTLYGDMCGGLAVISDVPKTTVYKMAERINSQAGRDIIPKRILTKAPSAELKPNQTDQDTLPPYDTLDGILHLYIEQHQSPQQIIEAGFDSKIVRDVIRRVDTNEYKRRQMATGLKVSARAFGVGWRMPIAAKWNS